MFCALALVCVCHVSEGIWEGEREREVFQGGSGLTAGYNRDTPKSRLIRPAGGEQCTCI